jgi:hypothetical protein
MLTACAGLTFVGTRPEFQGRGAGTVRTEQSWDNMLRGIADPSVLDAN